MKITYFFFTVLFLTAALCCSGQESKLPEDFFTTKPATPVSKENEENEEIEIIEETTLDIDKEILPYNNSEEQKDSTNNERWKNFLSDLINETQELYNTILQIDSNNITQEKIEEYRKELQIIKNKYNLKKEHTELWKNNETLDELHFEFDKFLENTSYKLTQLEKVSSPDEKKNKIQNLITIGICLLAVMAIVPVFTQIKSGLMMKKVKKEQEKQAKYQQEEEERQMLLSDEKNIITIKGEQNV